MSLEYFVNFDDLPSLVGVKLTLKDLETHNVQVNVLDESTGQHVKEGSIVQCQNFTNTMNVPGLYSLQTNLVDLAQVGLIGSSWLPTVPLREHVKVEAGRILVTRSNDGWFIYYLDYPESRKVSAAADDKLIRYMDAVEKEDPQELTALFSYKNIQRDISTVSECQAALMVNEPGSESFVLQKMMYTSSAKTLSDNLMKRALDVFAE